MIVLETPRTRPLDFNTLQHPNGVASEVGEGGGTWLSDQPLVAPVGLETIDVEQVGGE